MENEHKGHRLREEELTQSKQKIKYLSSVLQKVEENIRRDIRSKKYNEADLRRRVKNYKK